MSPERPDIQQIIPENQEAKTPLKIGIYEETDKLKSVAIWGPIGAEACLTQLYPEKISLFLDQDKQMDVLQARRECQSFSSSLRHFGIDVIDVRDELAKTLKPRHLQKEHVQQELLKKADNIVAEYPTKLTPGQIDYNKNSIIELLDQDIQKYGLDQALTLNRMLSLRINLPLGDALYARDQMNVLLGKRIEASMKKPIRRPEVGLYNVIYERFLEPNNNIKIPNGETFEGGDAYVHNKIIYVGVGTRTSLGAAKHIFQELQPEIKQHGFEFAIVVDPNALEKSPEDQMDSMHLDTISMPAGPKQMLVCEEETCRRDVYIAKTNGDEVEFVNTDKSFLEFLVSKGEEIITLPKIEQKNFGANLLVIDRSNILVPLASNKETNTQLKKTGKNILSLDLAECTKGYGAAHCMTGQLLREPEIIWQKKCIK